jgi:hypothetical protein
MHFDYIASSDAFPWIVGEELDMSKKMWLVATAALSLMWASSFAAAQGIVPGIALPNTSFSSGQIPGDESTPRSAFGHNGIPGQFFADYFYRSYNQEGGVNFSELNLSYYLPLQLGKRAAGLAFVTGSINSLDQQDKPDWLKADITVGGSGQLKIAGDSYVGIRGEYDALLRGTTWNSGGQVGVQMFCPAGGNGYTGVRLNWYLHSARDTSEFSPTPGGYDVTVAYRHAVGPYMHLMLSLAGYEMDLQEDAKQRGFSVGAGISSGFLNFKSFVGRDNLNKCYFSLGGGVTLFF